jgi:hypothetical protein
MDGSVSLLADGMASKPDLVFSEPVKEYLTEAYAKAETIFEYGTGGSTVLAMGMDAKTVVSVESDWNWLSRVNNYIDRYPSTSTYIPYFADIGPTKSWGQPTDDRRWRKFPDYAFGIWNFAEARGLVPDLVLIDGRFRIGCFIASMLNVSKSTAILFDDYTNRWPYHIVERFAEPVLFVDKMAVFETGRVALAAKDFALLSKEIYRTL